MTKIFKVIGLYLKLFGFDLGRTAQFFGSLPYYLKTYFRLKKQLKGQTDFRFSTFLPMMTDRKEKSGAMSGHYFHQDLLIARKIFENKPAKHVDIGSRIDGFVAHVSVFREIEVFDIRPQKSKVKNIVFKQADLMQLQSELEGYCDSLSSLHVIEHFGLGRYGDPIDKDGHIKAINNYYKILKTDGTLYLSVPMGKQRIEFNAHRVFALSYLVPLLEKNFSIKSFSYINDAGEMFEDIDFKSDMAKNNFNCKFGCAIFELKK